jgi:hypothetical protein
MKKLLFCLLMFATSTSLAQTKEETIEWLKEKLDVAAEVSGYYAYSPKQIDWIHINECEMEIRYSYKHSNIKYDYTLYIPLKGLGINYDDEFALDYDGIKKVDNGASDQEGWSVGSKDADYFTRYTDYIKINETEPNLHERIIKAINHLSTFCVEEEEPF